MMTQCWLDDGHGIEAIMMTQSAGWMMAWYRGYNDDTVLAGRWHGIEATMMTQCWLDDRHGIEATMMTHSAGWMMGMV